MHVLIAPYMVPTRSWANWSLPGRYLFSAWSLSGPYLVLMRPRLGLYGQKCGPDVVPSRLAWSLHGSYPVLVPTWSIPDQYLVQM